MITGLNLTYPVNTELSQYTLELELKALNNVSEHCVSWCNNQKFIMAQTEISLIVAVAISACIAAYFLLNFDSLWEKLGLNDRWRVALVQGCVVLIFVMLVGIILWARYTCNMHSLEYVT